jgi:F0F1-type ATP synthase membrane subunit a
MAWIQVHVFQHEFTARSLSLSLSLFLNRQKNIVASIERFVKEVPLGVRLYGNIKLS